MTPFSFDRVVLFGASILNSFGLNGRLTQYLFDQYGLTVALVNAGVGGDNAQNGRDRIDSVVAAVPEGETAVFVVHLGGNDIGGGNSIWENAGNRATYVSNMTAIYNAIVNAGHVCVFCTISFRQFGTPTNSVGDFGGNSYDDPEAYGADKVNVEVLIPMIASLDPSQINTDGRPYMDFHNWVYNSGPFIIDTDGRHLIEYKGPCKWIGDVLYSLSTTGASPVVNRVADPRIAGAHRPASVHLNFQSEGLGPDCYIKGLNTIVTGYSYLLGPDNSPAGIRCQAPATGSFGNNGRGTTTQKQLDYLSGAQTASYNRVSAGGSALYTLSNLLPGTIVDFVASSSRNTTNTYITRISLDGVSLGEKNSASTSVTQTFSGQTTVGEDGTLEILLESPQNFGYINSARLDFTYPAPAITTPVQQLGGTLGQAIGGSL